MLKCAQFLQICVTGYIISSLHEENCVFASRYHYKKLLLLFKKVRGNRQHLTCKSSWAVRDPHRSLLSLFYSDFWKDRCHQGSSHDIISGASRTEMFRRIQSSCVSPAKLDFLLTVLLVDLVKPAQSQMTGHNSLLCLRQAAINRQRLLQFLFCLFPGETPMTRHRWSQELI